MLNECMRILVDARHLGNGQQTGVGEYTVQLLRALFRSDTENEYILLTSGMRRPDLPLPTPFSHIHVAAPNKLLNASIAFARRPTLDRLVGGRIDLVFLPNLNFVAPNPLIPTVLTIHDLSWKHSPQYYSHKMRLWHRTVQPARLIGDAARVIVPSQSTHDDLVRAFQKSSDQIAVVPHGIDSAFQPRPEPRDHGVRSRYNLPKRYALYMGTLEPRKNIAAILDAVAAYRERTRDDLHLVLAGGWGWNARDLKTRLATRYAQQTIHHLGYVPSQDRPALYRNAAVFIWPSKYEGFGLPILEAMACGTPVITSHTSSMPEVAGSAAILIDPFDPRDITVALEHLLHSKNLSARLRSAGLERAKTFSWDTAARRTLDVFASAAKKPLP